MSDEPVEILRVVTYNSKTVSRINNVDNSLRDNQQKYFTFLVSICIGSTIAILSFIALWIGVIFPSIEILSEQLWQICLIIIISCMLSMFICHCYRYEAFELYFTNKLIQKRIIDSGWINVIERMHIKNEDANINSIKLFRRIPWVLPIANRIDKNVLWFIRKTAVITESEEIKLKEEIMEKLSNDNHQSEQSNLRESVSLIRDNGNEDDSDTNIELHEYGD